MPKPTILDDELVDEIQTLAASGFIQRSIAYAVGIGTTTLSNWKRLGEKLDESKRDSWTEAEHRYWKVYQSLRKSVNEHRKKALLKVCEFETPQAAQWYLERSFRNGDFVKPVAFNEEEIERWLYTNFSPKTVEQILILMENDEPDQPDIQDDSGEDESEIRSDTETARGSAVEAEYSSLSDGLFQPPEQNAAAMEGDDR